MAHTGLSINFEEPAGNPLKTLAASRQISLQAVGPDVLPLLEAALAKAQVGLCDYSVVIAVCGDLDADFQVRSPHQITLHHRVFAFPTLLELHLRHAIELVLWLQSGGGAFAPAPALAVALLAALTARRFYLQMPEEERQRLSQCLPAWLQCCSRSLAPEAEARVLEQLAEKLDALLLLQGRRREPPAPLEEALRIAREFAPVANPTEFILTQQGDDRLLVDPATGLNKYGCSPRPRPEAITFSSCTASSVSEFAYAEAERLRHRLMRTLPEGRLAIQYETEMESIRTGLRELLDLDQLQTEVILSSSGTDAELYPLMLFRSSDQRKLINIVVAPDEVGSGTVLAAGGRHFSATTPHGARVRQGDVLDATDADAIEVVCIPIRDARGERLSQPNLEQKLAAAVGSAMKAADNVILHMVDNTKTGVVAPATEFVLGLRQQWGPKLHVVVDACQFRIEQVNLHRYLAHGFCLLVTGSKFFTGPPFCGALLVPGGSGLGRNGPPLPRSFADYFTRSEVPLALQSQAQNLSSALNLGLLFRWTGALREMKSFYCVASPQRTAILQAFRNALVDSICRNPDLRLIECVPPQRWQDSDLSLWDALPTIFSFAVRHPGVGASHRWLPLRELKAIYYLLNCNCASSLPPGASFQERALAAQKCHIGQPITIARDADGHETSALRIACGARLVYGITFDSALGRNPAERFQRELHDAQTVLAKVSLILKYWREVRPAAPAGPV